MKLQQVRPLLMASMSVLISTVAVAQSSDEGVWQQQIIASVKSHPLIIAQTATLNAQQARAQGKRQSLYNPELNTSYERERNANNYQVGISQTIDWWDKGDVLNRSADNESLSAQLAYDLLLINTTADLLRAIVKRNTTARQFEFSKQQEQRVYTLIEQIKERRSAGDLGQIDSQLALLTLSQNFNQTAQTIERFEDAKMGVKRLLPNANAAIYSIPDSFWLIDVTRVSPRLASEHPQVLLAQSQWNEQREKITLAKISAKGDPTIGLSVGRNGLDNTVGVNFSMPLNVRNNYSHNIVSAQNDALSLEFMLKNTLIDQRASLTKARNIVASYQQRLAYQRDAGLIFSEKTNEQTIALLKKQWKTGDVNTADYLIAMQQISDGWLATIAQQASHQIAVIDYLEQSGTLMMSISSAVIPTKK